MERNQKQSNPIIFDIAYTLTSQSQPYIYLNIILIAVQFALFLLKIYDIIDPSIQHIYAIPYQSLFTILAIFVGVFIVFTLVSYTFEWLPTIWFYTLLFLQAIQLIYVEMTVRCFVGDSWCQSDSRSKLMTILVIIVFTLIIGLRLQCYNPFYDSSNALAMKSGKNVLYSYIYTWLLSLATNQLIISSSTGSKQMLFFITACYYSFIFTPPTFSPIMSRTIILCANALLWTSGVAWLIPLVQQLLGGTPISFWYYWGYSVPIVLLLSFLHSSKLMNSYNWKTLFFQKHTGDLTDLFLQVNQLRKEIELIKKSDLATNSPQFKKLWKIITFHNDKCLDTQCPLASLNSLKIIREDELLEEKRFNRTVQKTLQFGLYCLTSQRQTYPNLIALSLKIAHFQLEVFRLRTKGLQLYNKQWNNAQLQEKWAIYYMKKRIQSFEGSGEASSGQREQVIASFKHQIQKSVGMLAQFWYFLSDPKCNLKKLYDLANVLFPQKRSVDQAWKYIRGLKNVDCHTLYAKYLIRMFNDKDKGLKVLEQAKRLQIEAHQKQQMSAGQVPSEEHGVIFLQFDGKNSGIMYQVNSACERLFGYNKGQLQGRKVNDIMPRFFAMHHDRILEHYQQTNRPRMMNKQRSVWGRSKDGYCFPFLICIKPVRNYFSQTNEVYASVKRDLWLKQKAFFFVDTELHITDISASMLGIYPELAGRIYLKKKVHLSQIIPDHQSILPKLVELQQSHDLQITRTFNLNSKQTFSETLFFVMQAEEIITAVAGKIGYHFKLTKGGSSSNYDPSMSNQSNLSRQKASGFGRQFKLIASMSQGQKGKKVVYQGGLIKDISFMKSQMISRISESIAKQKQFAKQEEVSRLATDWAGNIKTKRLQGTLIRQIHDLSQESQLNGVVGGNQNSEDEGQTSQMIKPCQLNAILERQKVNKPILLLKILAITILVVCTLLYILEYLSIHNFKNQIINFLKSYTELNSLTSQTMYVNNFANRIRVNGTKQTDLDIFASDVFDLDNFTGAIPFSINSQLTYSDGTSQSMLLSFAINKLVSQSDLLATSGASTEYSQTTLFFVQYNSVNGLQVGCQQALRVSWNNISIFYSQGIVFLAICLSLVIVAFLVQNIVLRKVLNKKADILNIFFEIPRYTCSFLQKQCQRFIQKLTNNQQEEDIELQALEEQGQSNTKKNKTQKKRTIMGEEKTASEFLVISFLMIAYFLIYPVMIQRIEQKGSAAKSFTLQSIKEIVSMQKQISKAMSFMNTHLVNTSLPLSNQQNAMGVINDQYNLVINLLGNVTTNLFYIGDILDKQYLNDQNSLFYSSLCSENATCNTQLGEDKGLNPILFNYIDYLISKYLLIKNTTSYNISSMYSYQIQTKQQIYKSLIKKYWRQLQVLVINAFQRYLQLHDSLFFGFMLAFSVLNLSVLLWAWLKFYNQLQKKIKATQYILTFIPLDQINKNPKIVEYIKQKIVKIN